MGLLFATKFGPDWWKRMGTRAPKMWKFGRHCEISAVFPTWLTQYADPDEIKSVSIDPWLAVAWQIWPRYREFAHAAGFPAARRCLWFLVGQLVSGVFIHTHSASFSELLHVGQKRTFADNCISCLKVSGNGLENCLNFTLSYVEFRVVLHRCFYEV